MKYRSTAGNLLCVAFVVLFVAIRTASTASGAVISMYVLTDKTNYFAGELVEWSIVFDIENSTALDNFGIATISANLSDSVGETLTAGTVNVTNSPSFVTFDITSGGSWDAPTNTLYEISALDFQQDPATIGAHGSSLTNILLARGSYVATRGGTHILSVTPGSTNTHFTAAGQDFFAATSYTAINLSNATLNVTAVPEPSSIALMSLGCAFLCRSVIRRRKGQI
jgi:hypothetical protein